MSLFRRQPLLFALAVCLGLVGTHAQTFKHTGSSWCSKHGHYQGTECPKCAAEKGGGNAGSAPPPPPDPRVIALQNAIPRYEALVRLISDDNILDKQAWLSLPHRSEDEFFAAANNLHQVLLDIADANRYSAAVLQEELTSLNQVIATYPERIDKLRADLPSKTSERDAINESLQKTELLLEIHHRAANQLNARAAAYRQDVQRDWQEVQDWLTVLLPPSLVAQVSPKPYESIVEPMVGTLPERTREAEPIALPQPIALHPSHNAFRLPVQPAPLSGTAEDAVAQLEADRAALMNAQSNNGGWVLRNEVGTKRPLAASLMREEDEVRQQVDALAAEIKETAARKKDAVWNLVLAQDAVQAAGESLLYRGAEAWIWENGKTEITNRLKQAVRQRVTAGATAVPYRDLTELEVQDFIAAGKHNVFELGDKILSSGDGLSEVLDEIETLRTRGQGYAEEATRLAAQGSPQEIERFVGGMFQGLDEDAAALVKANLGAMDVPEPWRSISAKYFVSSTP